MLYDIFLFFNESALFKARYQYLKDIIDVFVIYESDLTFSGEKKEFMFYDYFPELTNAENIEYVKIEGDANIEEILAQMKTNDIFTNPYKSYHWKHGGKTLASLSDSFIREVYQRDYIGSWIKQNCSDGDVIVLGDVDEIPAKELLQIFRNELLPKYFKQDWRLYFVNKGLEANWIGTKMVKKKHITELSVDLLVRDKENIKSYNSDEIINNGGWHLSSLGGIGAIRKKMIAYDYQGSRLKYIYKFLDLFGNTRIWIFLTMGRDIIDPRMRLIKKQGSLPKPFCDL